MAETRQAEGLGGNANRTAAFEEIYFQTRYPAMALALALTLGPDRAYRASLKAHIGFAAGRRGEKTSPALLQRLFRKAALSQKPEAGSGLQAFSALADENRIARGVWALREACSFTPEETLLVTGAPEPVQQEILEGMQRRLGARDAEQFRALAGQLLSRKEMLADIQFGLGKRKSAGRAVLRAAAAALLALFVFLAARETLGYLSIMRQAPAKGAATASARYADADFYKRFPEEPSRENPRISKKLMEEMAGMGDKQEMRVAFRFYDREAMLAASENGKTLEDWYQELYETSLDAGKVNTLIANAVSLYYSNYTRPFLTKERAHDFASAYQSIREAALSLTADGAFEGTVRNHPEIFGDEEGFSRYLLSPAFLREVPYLQGLLTLETRLKGGETETGALRLAYEDAIFAFTNPSGLNGVATAQGYSFDNEALKAFYPIRERLGQQLYENNLARCQALFPAQAQLASDLLEGGDSGLFSATISRETLMKLANDGRFYFLGLTPLPLPGKSGRVEAELARQAYEGLWQRHDIYMIDENYLLYSVNFAAPLNLPQGFVDDLRSKLGCEDTLFEKELQYHYKMRYAHPQTRYGYGILRLLDRRPGLGFTTRQYKYFSRMAVD